MASILWLITILLAVLWLLGYAVNIGAWINFLLVVAVILLVINLVSAAFRRPRIRLAGVRRQETECR